MEEVAPLVLLADDDAASTDVLRAALRASGATVVSCRRAAVGVDAIAFHHPSAVVVDPELDGARGWEVLRAAHREGRTPIVALDRTGNETSRRAAIAAGAHEVAAKPFTAEELAARVLALARLTRAEAKSGPVYRHGDLVVDVAAHAVRVAGRPVPVTAEQFAILRQLCEAGGTTLARSQLLAHVAAIDEEAASERAIDLHVTRLRRRLGDDPHEPRYVETVYGVGYRLARHRASPASRALDGRAAEVLEALAEPVLVVDTGLVIRYANPAAERLLGRTRASMLGLRCAEVLQCRAGGLALDGPRCLGRAVLGNGGELRRAGAVVRGADGSLGVELSYGRVSEGAGALLAITLHPRPDAA